MNPSILNHLCADDFKARLGFVATAPALRRLLKRSPEILAIRQALVSGELSEFAIREFVQSLMKNLQQGVPFQHDLAVSALAVALERRATPFAEAFLQELAHLQAAEMQMSIRVARDCLKERVSLAGNQRGVVDFGLPQQSIALSYKELGRRFPHQQTAQSRQTLKCGSS